MRTATSGDEHFEEASRRGEYSPGSMASVLEGGARVLLRWEITLLLLTGCSMQGDEVARIPSPDRLSEAVVVEQGGGATTSFFYVVCLVEKNQACGPSERVATLYDAARNASAYGVNVRWQDGHHLVIEYVSAKRAELVGNVSRRGPKVTVQLNPGVVDATAPAGSMARQADKQGGKTLGR